MSESNRPLKKTAGVSLIELMVSTFVMLIGVAAAAGALGASIAGTQNSQNVTKLVWAVRQKAEELKFQPLSSISSGSDYVDSNGTPQSSSSGAAYSRTWTVTANSPLQGLTDITVIGTVARPSGNVAAVSLTVHTYRAN